ncbi:hypothetical protein [Flavobacterium pectinovorum]|uniref:Uncharacterized protein n=1 Tax=Flavobacterium pectinovorum TaxID=29533 RepID=A0A502F2F9_9FLAO|nr:hypothetical protein [Flavobacterium pectinovorum]TPG44348.1 hypothetical protein EAH81_02420 [Flavobacterium pectinovorum]
MAIFTPLQLKTYVERVELQKDLLPLSPIFTSDQKTELDSLYDKILEICYTSVIKEKEVIEPIILQ